MDDVKLRALAEKYGTPLFVFDAFEVRNRAEEIKQIMNRELSERKIGLVYSIKANPFLIPVLLPVVDHFEVCSPGELSICIHEKVPGEKIIYSGVHKEKEDITEAVRYGASILTAESYRHYQLIRKAASKQDSPVRMILRLCAKSQFGMSIRDIERILKENQGNRQPEIIGLHYFVGTQRLKTKRQIEELEMLAEELQRLRRSYDLPLPFLEYGPGLGFPYFEGDDFSDTLRPLKEISESLAKTAAQCTLSVEMGRFLASSCGYYLTRVSDVKSSFDKNWCILDGGIHHVNYLGQIMGMKVPVIRELSEKRREGEKVSVTLCGSLCTTNDILVREYMTKSPDIGDLLAFCNIGAYSVTEGMSLFLSRDMPKIVTDDNGRDSLIRDTVSSWKLNTEMTDQ